MSEWLTIGQMIDRLEKDQVAETGNGFRVKRTSGAIMFVDEHNQIDRTMGDQGYLTLVNGYVLSTKWRILPNYVSFEEAMQALKEGKYVNWYSPDGGDSVIFTPTDYFDEEETADFRFKELVEGKWTIKGTMHNRHGVPAVE